MTRHPTDVAHEGRAARVVVQAHRRGDGPVRRIGGEEPTVRDDAAHVVVELRIIPGIEVHERHEREEGLLVARTKGPNGIPCRGMHCRTMAPRGRRPHHAQLRFFGVASDHDASIELPRNDHDASAMRLLYRSHYGCVTFTLS